MMRIVQLMLVVLVISLQPEAVYSQAWYNQVGDWFSGPFAHFWSGTFPGWFVTAWDVSSQGVVKGWNSMIDAFGGGKNMEQKMQTILNQCGMVEQADSKPVTVANSIIPVLSITPVKVDGKKTYQGEVQLYDDKGEPTRDLNKVDDEEFNISSSCTALAPDASNSNDPWSNQDSIICRLKRRSTESKDERQEDIDNRTDEQRANQAAVISTVYYQCKALFSDGKFKGNKRSDADTEFNYDNGTSTEFDTDGFCNTINIIGNNLYNLNKQKANANLTEQAAQGVQTTTRVGGYDDSYDSYDHDIDSADN